MSKRKYEPGSFVPCSPKHKHCSPAHAALVAGYRAERERQLLLFEEETGGYEGDKKLWKESNTLINFKTWLVANKTTTNKSIQNEKIYIVKQGRNLDSPILTKMKSNNTLMENISNEEICNCDCWWCCANDHDACSADCAS